MDKILVELLNMGYAVKTQSALDRRVFYVTLAEPGEQLVSAKYRTLKEFGELISASLSEQEAEQFERTLVKVTRLVRTGNLS